MFHVIIMTHEELGEIYLRVATRILGEQTSISAVSVSPATPSCEAIHAALADILESAGPGTEVLILTDLFGATPCNASRIYSAEHRARFKILAGLNLPMLLKALTVRDRPLAEAVEAVVSAGKAGIFDASDM